MSSSFVSLPVTEHSSVSHDNGQNLYDTIRSIRDDLDLVVAMFGDRPALNFTLQRTKTTKTQLLHYLMHHFIHPDPKLVDTYKDHVLVRWFLLIELTLSPGDLEKHIENKRYIDYCEIDIFKEENFKKIKDYNDISKLLGKSTITEGNKELLRRFNLQYDLHPPKPPKPTHCEHCHNPYEEGKFHKCPPENGYYATSDGGMVYCAFDKNNRMIYSSNEILLHKFNNKNF